VCFEVGETTWRGGRKQRGAGGVGSVSESIVTWTALVEDGLRGSMGGYMVSVVVSCCYFCRVSYGGEDNCDSLFVEAFSTACGEYTAGWHV
jgi:hypothetical protein